MTITRSVQLLAGLWLIFPNLGWAINWDDITVGLGPRYYTVALERFAAQTDQQVREYRREIDDLRAQFTQPTRASKVEDELTALADGKYYLFGNQLTPEEHAEHVRLISSWFPLTVSALSLEHSPEEAVGILGHFLRRADRGKSAELVVTDLSKGSLLISPIFGVGEAVPVVEGREIGRRIDSTTYPSHLPKVSLHLSFPAQDGEESSLLFNRALTLMTDGDLSRLKPDQIERVRSHSFWKSPNPENFKSLSDQMGLLHDAEEKGEPGSPHIKSLRSFAAIIKAGIVHEIYRVAGKVTTAERSGIWKPIIQIGLLRQLNEFYDEYPEKKARVLQLLHDRDEAREADTREKEERRQKIKELETAILKAEADLGYVLHGLQHNPRTSAVATAVIAKCQLGQAGEKAD